MSTQDHMLHAAMECDQAVTAVANADRPQGRLLAMQRLQHLVDHLADLVYQVNVEQVEEERDADSRP